MRKLENKIALVTGGNAGLGKAAAILFAKEGAKVAIAARRESEGRAVVEEIREAGGEAIFVRTDVSKGDDCKKVVAETVLKYGKLDIALNNAGVISYGKNIHEVSEEDWLRVIGINLTGVFLSMKYQIPEMLKAGAGSIINMSSVGGLIATGMGLGAYHAAKHGVLGLTKEAAIQYAQRNIRVNALCPGLIATDMADDWFANADVRGAVAALHPVGRFGEAPEVAEAALFLASDATSFITGIALPVDGGFTSR